MSVMKRKLLNECALKYYLIRSMDVISIIIILLFLCHNFVISFAFRSVVEYKRLFCSYNQVVKGKEDWLFYQLELYYVTDSIPSVNLRSICEFDSVMRTLGITLFVVPVPNKIDIYPDKFTNIPAPHPVNRKRLDLINQLQKAGVRVINLVPIFETNKENLMLFDPYDTHWAPQGIELAARYIAENIDSALLIRNIPQLTRYFTGDTMVDSYKNLLRKLKSTGKQPQILLKAKQVFCDDGTPFDFNKYSEILIFGDSFVGYARRYSSQLGAHLSRFIRHPVRTYFSHRFNTEGLCSYYQDPKLFPENGIVIWVFTSRCLPYHFSSLSDCRNASVNAKVQ
jgi:hypothetical protein